MIRYIAILCCLGLMLPISAQAKTYGQKLCKNAQYTCIKTKPGDSWKKLFPNPQEQEIVRKVNRMNTALRSGMLIAVPKNLSASNYMSLSPFPNKIAPSKKNMIKVDLTNLAWGAFDTNGVLVNWGPISGGMDYCASVKRACKTITGTYTVQRRQGANCKSSKYPLPNGGAPMPYCMHFHGGYAMHGSPVVPGHHASHGCVRMFTDDARWLNQSFIKVGSTAVKIYK